MNTIPTPDQPASYGRIFPNGEADANVITPPQSVFDIWLLIDPATDDKPLTTAHKYGLFASRYPMSQWYPADKPLTLEDGRVVARYRTFTQMVKPFRRDLLNDPRAIAWMENADAQRAAGYNPTVWGGQATIPDSEASEADADEESAE